jgi:hypothetical protein
VAAAASRSAGRRRRVPEREKITRRGAPPRRQRHPARPSIRAVATLAREANDGHRGSPRGRGERGGGLFRGRSTIQGLGPGARLDGARQALAIKEMAHGARRDRRHAVGGHHTSPSAPHPVAQRARSRRPGGFSEAGAGSRCRRGDSHGATGPSLAHGRHRAIVRGLQERCARGGGHVAGGRRKLHHESAAGAVGTHPHGRALKRSSRGDRGPPGSSRRSPARRRAAGGQPPGGGDRDRTHTGAESRQARDRVGRAGAVREGFAPRDQGRCAGIARQVAQALGELGRRRDIINAAATRALRQQVARTATGEQRRRRLRPTRRWRRCGPR